MTVSSSFTDKVYQISGTSTVYPWAQDLDTQYGSLVVTEETNSTDKEVVQTFVEGEDYNVVNKDVVFVTAPTDTDHYIRITRNTYRGQPVKFNEGEDFPAEDYEKSLDRFAMSQQEQDKALAEEKEARIKADEILQENIDAEAEARRNADITLQQNIDNEALARQNADITLQENIDAEETRAKAAEKAINDTLNTFGDIVTHDADEFATASQGAKADSAVQPSDLADVATSGSYNDLDDTPTIGNGTITIKQDNEVVGSFKTNQSGDTTINLTGGGSGGGNDSIYTTSLVTFQANEASASVDLSLTVDANTLYVPYVFVDSQYTENLDHTAIYQKSSKTLTFYRDSRFISSSLSFTAYVTLVATGAQNIDTAAGYTTGQYYTEYNRSYSKTETDTLLGAKQGTIDSTHKVSADLIDDSTSTNKFVDSNEKAAIGTALQPADITNMQTTTNLVTSVSSSSTDTEYPSAKLFYDTCGDIETLINAL